MGNPFFNRFGQSGQVSGPLGSMTNFIDQFKAFRSQFQGDPQAQVQELLNSGKMSQEQFNYLSNIATQFKGILK